MNPTDQTLIIGLLALAGVSLRLARFRVGIDTICALGALLLLSGPGKLDLRNGEPTLLERLTGQGRVIALTSGWQPGDSQLALSTKFVPFIGAVTAVGVFGISSAILGESFSSIQVAGIALLIFASFLFSYEKDNGQPTRHAGFGWALLSGLLFAVSHVAAKHFYGDYSFLTGLVWTKGLVGIVALFAFFGMRSERAIASEGPSGKSSSVWLVIADKVLAIAGTLAIQYAIAIGSVAIVSGLVGLQYALILVFAFVSTVFAPRFFSEHFTRKEVAFEVIAIILVVAGIYLLI